MLLKNGRVIILALLAITISGRINLLHAQFLSKLTANQNSPLYTTYAAAKARSEFALDEGYHLTYYDTTKGVDFSTDTGGDWDLAFIKGANYVYRLNDLYQKPVISASYPDMVSYFYKPFKNVLLNARFFVYSSHTAIQDITLKNTGSKTLTFRMVPFLRNRYRDFNNVKFGKNQNAVTFTHRELPDGWVLGHKSVPYVSNIKDIFMMSEKPDLMTSYRSYKWGKVKIPHQVVLDKKPEYPIHGTIFYANGNRISPDSTKPVFTIMLNNDSTKILTETAPHFGNSSGNITPYSTYSIDLGNFKNLKNGDTYTLTFACRNSDESATIKGTVQNLDAHKGVKQDIHLTKQSLPATPGGFGHDIWGSGTEVRLYWKKSYPNERFRVYRRDYRNQASYRLVANNIKQPFYADKDITGDKIYGYLVMSVDKNGNMSMFAPEINNIAGSNFLTDMRYPNQLKNDVKDYAKVIAMPTNITLNPGETKHFRIVRSVERPFKNDDKLLSEARKAMQLDVEFFAKTDKNLYRNIPDIHFTNPDKTMLYYSAFNMMDQEMLPPEGQLKVNYYVFSREPQWGWGHGGQVFHESMSMLAYALMNPQSAMNSQRVYLETQHKNGYINYRTGAYLDESIPTNGQLTSSAPLYAWENWKIYEITKDKHFLRQMYQSSKEFYNFFVTHRDADGDGLCEWGGHAVLESLRDSQVAVWDQVGWPANFEDLGLNCMLVQEAKSLSKMARVLGKNKESQTWMKKAQKRSDLINKYMWDPQTGFYYNVSKKDNSFTYKKHNDLKRQEIIGFLPLWAGVASKKQAKILIKTLTNKNKFWRKYGVPSLSAEDSYYNPKGYWNGPVWVQWNYMIEDGLLKYGYNNLAKELVNKIADNMISQLKKNHTLWEFYSPDSKWGGWHQTYIWAGIINRMFLDLKSNNN